MTLGLIPFDEVSIAGCPGFDLVSYLLPIYFVVKLFGTEEEKQSGRPQIREVKIQPDKFDNC